MAILSAVKQDANVRMQALATLMQDLQKLKSSTTGNTQKQVIAVMIEVDKLGQDAATDAQTEWKWHG